MNIITKLRVLLKARKIWRLILSDIGDLNQARIQADRANKTAPDGIVLVTVAKAPVAAAGVSTISAGGATGIAAAAMWILGRFAPDLTAEQLTELGAGLAVLITFGFAWLRKRHELANTPGVGTPS